MKRLGVVALVLGASFGCQTDATDSSSIDQELNGNVCDPNSYVPKKWDYKAPPQYQGTRWAITRHTTKSWLVAQIDTASAKVVWAVQVADKDLERISVYGIRNGIWGPGLPPRPPCGDDWLLCGRELIANAVHGEQALYEASAHVDACGQK